jgi:hypothetical protein
VNHESDDQENYGLRVHRMQKEAAWGEGLAAVA